MAPLQRDMAVRMREVLAWPWVGVCVPLASSFQGKFNLFFINYCISKQIQQRARIGKIFARWHLAIAIASYLDSKKVKFKALRTYET